MFAFQDKRGSVEVAFTDRFGGVSPGPFAELDLALPKSPGAEPQHEPADVARNWELVVEQLAGGARRPEVVGMRQVHGAHVEVVEPTHRSRPEAEGDALVTAGAGVVLAARAADCVPVLLADPARGAVAAVHAGRKGVVAGVVPNALRALRHLGAEQVVAWIGPHACGRCYEVPEEMADDVAAGVPEARAETSWGTPALDLGAGVRAQLAAAAEVVEVVDVGRCTIEDPALYSYRRDGAGAGRHAGLIWVRP